MPTNGGSRLEPMKTEENTKLKYIIGISAAVLVVVGIVVAIYCLLRRRCCDERIEANDGAGTKRRIELVTPILRLCFLILLKTCEHAATLLARDLIDVAKCSHNPHNIC